MTNAQVWRQIVLVLAILGFGFAGFLWLLQSSFQLRLDYTLRSVALGGALLGSLSAVLGSFAVLRQQSLLGDALAHAALPGVALGFLLSGRELSALLIGAAVSGWMGMQFIQTLVGTTRLKQDVALGIVLSAWFAAGIILLAYAQNRPDASQAGLDTFIFGQAAAIIEEDLWLMFSLSAVLLCVLLLLWHPLKAVTFDSPFAATIGLPVRLLRLILTTMIVITIVMGLQLAGVILMVGLLIAPGVAARQWSYTLAQMALLAAGFGAFSGGMGASISALDADIPTGPTIIVVTFLLLLISISLAPERGLLWRWLRERKDRRAVLSQQLLRDMLRYALGHGGSTHATPNSFLVGIHGAATRACLQSLKQDGLVERVRQTPEEHSWRLTQTGLAEAERGSFQRRMGA